MWLYVSLAVNIFLIIIVTAFCVRYSIPGKILRRFVRMIYGGNDNSTGNDGVIDVVNTKEYKLRVNVFENLPDDADEVIFLGDSLTYNTPFSEFLHSNYRIKNRGISSDNTQGVLKRIDDAVRSRPVKIFIMLGINDIGNGIELTESMKNYRTIIQRIKTLSPSTKIYMQSIFPVNHEKLADNARNSRRTSEKIKLFNQELFNLSQEQECEFIDTYSVLKIEGEDELDGNYTFDGLHLNGVGMKKWAEFLEHIILMER